MKFAKRFGGIAIIGLIILLGVSLGGCGSLTELIPLLQPTGTPQATAIIPTPTIEVEEPTVDAGGVEGVTTLTIWLLPPFDPHNDSSAGALLLERLDEYTALHPGLGVDVRVKSEKGLAGILESLITTSKAAPLALPDLVLLPNQDLETAIETALIFPYPDGIPAEEDTDWYEAAQTLGVYREQRFGLPFMTDALVMAYEIDNTESVPTTWEALLESGSQLSFPAADPTASVTLAWYLHNGGTFTAEDGTRTIDQTQLEEVFDFYSAAQTAGVMPFWLTQYDNEELSWETFIEGSPTLAIAWASRYLQYPQETLRAVPLPTNDGTPYTLLDGWVWALTSTDPNRQAAAAELASFLTQAEFLSAYSQAAGYLPPRPFALTNWATGPKQTMASQILPAAQPFPAASTINLVSPPISQAVVDILKQEKTPTEAVEAVLGEIN